MTCFAHLASSWLVVVVASGLSNASHRAMVEPLVTGTSAVAPPVASGAFSRKTHGIAGTFDLALSLAVSDPTTEPRSGGAGRHYTIAFAFDKPMTGGTACVTAGAATAGTPTFNGNELIVPTDRRFNRANLNVEEPIGRVKRPFSAATGCSVRWSWRFRAGADAKVAARGQAGGGRQEAAQRRTRVSSDGDGGGYQAMRWSNSKAGMGGSSRSAAGSRSASAASHNGGPRAGAMRGGAVGSPRWARMSRTVGPSVVKAMMRISAPQSGHPSGKTS